MIVSCDLSDQVDTDCNGVHLGTAYIDDCGYCADGDTGRIPNVNKDCEGTCNGSAYEDECGECDTDSLNDNITCENECTADEYSNYDCNDGEYCWNYDDNVHCNCDLDVADGCGECGGQGYVGCMCNYIPENSLNYPCDKSDSKSIYGVGDQISCTDADDILDVCFPATCNNEFSLSDLYGKVTWIELTSTW